MATSSSPRTKSRLFVIGLDGATFDIINPLLEQGRLENFSRLIKQGSCGRLKSTIPAFSPIAWTSLVTGVNPGKHGITDAFIHHIDEYRMSPANSSYRKYKPVWSILNSFGRKTGIVNVPLTYPPEPVDGFIITGMFTPGSAEDFIYPPELRDCVKERIGKYVVEGVQSANLEAVLRTTYKSVEQKDRLSSYLLEKYDPDFFLLVYMATDRIQHQFWKFMDEKNPSVSPRARKRYRNAIKDIYERMDISIGRILKHVRDEDTLMIVSDHGFGPLHRAFSLSNWLIENGYTAYKHNSCASAQSEAMFRENLRISQLAGNRQGGAINNICERLEKIRRRFQGKSINSDGELNRHFNNIIWRKTKAFTEGAAGGIFINKEGRQKEGIVKHGDEYKKLCCELIDKLKDLTDPLTGSKVIKEIYCAEDIYSGDGLKGSPDLVVTCSPLYHTISPSESAYFRLDNRETFFTHTWSGKHEEEGIFIIKGPGIKRGHTLNKANIMDVAPTIVYLMDSPVSNEFDGKALVNAVREEYLASHPVSYSDKSALKTGSSSVKDFSEDESIEIKKKLKSLGYID